MVGYEARVRTDATEQVTAAIPSMLLQNSDWKTENEFSCENKIM